MTESLFREAIIQLNEFGVYDVVLPFLLVFTIVFAILEKTKILGVEKHGDHELTKKNLNSIVALMMAFLVVASTQLVAVINEVMANIVLLLILAISFLMLVGTFFTDKEFSLENSPNWVKFFMFAMFIGIVLIFLEALGWLRNFLDWWLDTPTTTLSGHVILLIIIILFIFFVTYEPKRHKMKEDS